MQSRELQDSKPANGQQSFNGVNKDKAMFEEEQGGQIKHVSDDKAITSGANVKDWHINKTGKTGFIYHTTLPSNRRSLSLRFKAQNAFEFRNIRVGLTIGRSETYLVVGPSPSVSLYAIVENERKQ